MVLFLQEFEQLVPLGFNFRIKVAGVSKHLSYLLALDFVDLLD